MRNGRQQDEDKWQELKIHQFGIVSGNVLQISDPDDQCKEVGPEYNPLTEYDADGRINPFQDPKRGRIERFLIPDGNQAHDGTIGVTTEPINLLQNLEGPKSIMGRSLVLSRGGDNVEDDMESISSCCIIARDIIPAGFGPMPTPYPLNASTHTYASYGVNYVKPVYTAIQITGRQTPFPQ